MGAHKQQPVDNTIPAQAKSAAEETDSLCCLPGDSDCAQILDGDLWRWLDESSDDTCSVRESTFLCRIEEGSEPEESETQSSLSTSQQPHSCEAVGPFGHHENWETEEHVKGQTSVLSIDSENCECESDGNAENGAQRTPDKSQSARDACDQALEEVLVRWKRIAQKSGALSSSGSDRHGDILCSIDEVLSCDIHDLMHVDDMTMPLHVGAGDQQQASFRSVSEHMSPQSGPCELAQAAAAGPCAEIDDIEDVEMAGNMSIRVVCLTPEGCEALAQGHLGSICASDFEERKVEKGSNLNRRILPPPARETLPESAGVALGRLVLRFCSVRYASL